MIGIVLLNYNSWDQLDDCIESIYKVARNLNYRIYVVDNNSSIAPSAEMRNKLKGKNITFVENDENKGYAAGNNVGINLALNDNCSHILISNTDVIFHEDSIENLAKYLDNNNQVGIVGPKIYNSAGEKQPVGRCFKTGIKEKYLINTPMRHLFKKLSNSFYCKDKNCDEIVAVHAVSGCCFMMSYRCAKDITPFDENTFLYEEELIIGINMEKKGYLTHYIPYSEITHAEGQSTKEIKSFSYRCFVESELYYCKKYLDAKLIQIIPLYLIRTVGFLKRASSNKDFRASFWKYLKGTMKSMVKTPN